MSNDRKLPAVLREIESYLDSVGEFDPTYLPGTMPLNAPAQLLLHLRAAQHRRILAGVNQQAGSGVPAGWQARRKEPVAFVTPTPDQAMRAVLRFQAEIRQNVTGTTNWAANLGMYIAEFVANLNSARSPADDDPTSQNDAIADENAALHAEVQRLQSELTAIQAQAVMRSTK